MNEITEYLNSSQVAALQKMLKDMKYGSITLIIQDGKVIQIDKTEKVRFRS